MSEATDIPRDDEVEPGDPEPADGGAATATASPARFPEVRAGGSRGAEAPLDRIYDLAVPVTVELGHATLSVQEILELAAGAVIELNQVADAPVELHVHGKCVAKGEIVVVDEFYGVRITSVGG